MLHGLLLTMVCDRRARSRAARAWRGPRGREGRPTEGTGAGTAAATPPADGRSAAPPFLAPATDGRALAGRLGVLEKNLVSVGRPVGRSAVA